METISHIIEKTKETIGLGHEEPHHQDVVGVSKKEATDEQDLDSGSHTVLETMKDTLITVFEKTKEIAGFGHPEDETKSLELKATEAKEASVQKKLGEGTHSGSHPQEPERVTRKMKNWNESLQKIEKVHERPLCHPNSTKQQHEQAPHVDEGTSSGEELKGDENAPSSEVQHTGLVATVSNALHSVVETGKDLIEKAKDSIPKLTTGTTTNEGELEQHVKPVHDDKRTPSPVQDSNQGSGLMGKVRQTMSKVGEEILEWTEGAAAKIEEWSEGSLGEVSDSTETKNQDSMTQPGQLEEMTMDQPSTTSTKHSLNIPPASKPKEASA